MAETSPSPEPSKSEMADFATPGHALTAPPGPPAGEAEEQRALVERARRRDVGAFRALVARHQDRVYAVALRITRSPRDAADVAQEVFLKAWQALPGFRGDAGFGTWLHQVVARRALDRADALLSRRGREVALEAAAEEPADLPPLRDRPMAARLERLLGGLSPTQRAVVTLFYLEEHSVEGVATALGMPGNTVKTHLYRARAALREAWLREEPEP